MKTYRVGIIGFGMIGKVHAFGYAALPYYCEPLGAKFQITHIATAHPETGEKAKQMTGAETATTDFRDITENPEVDIVHICTPNDQHLESLCSAIRHGKHIYCDKPLTVSAEQADEVARCMEKDRYSASSQMTFHLRFFPAIERAKQMIEEGRLGKIYQYRIAYLHSSNASPETPMKWKHGPAGGVVRDIASHALDLSDYLIGPIHSLLAETQLAIPQRSSAKGLVDVTVEDAVTILTRTEQDTHGIIQATKLATGHEDELELEIYGQKGALRFRLMDPHYLDYFETGLPDQPLGGLSGWKRIACGARFERPETQFPSPKSTIGWTRAHAACLIRFLQAVVQGKASTPDLTQGIKIDRIIERVFQSATTGNRLAVD